MMKILETRTTADGFKRRRYETPAGRITTIEVPIAVWNGINKQGRARDRAAQWTNARARDAARMEALRLHRQGWRTIAVASAIGTPVRTVQRWLKNERVRDVR